MVTGLVSASALISVDPFDVILHEGKDWREWLGDKLNYGAYLWVGKTIQLSDNEWVEVVVEEEGPSLLVALFWSLVYLPFILYACFRNPIGYESSQSRKKVEEQIEAQNKEIERLAEEKKRAALMAAPATRGVKRPPVAPVELSPVERLIRKVPQELLSKARGSSEMTALLRDYNQKVLDPSDGKLEELLLNIFKALRDPLEQLKSKPFSDRLLVSCVLCILNSEYSHIKPACEVIAQELLQQIERDKEGAGVGAGVPFRY